MLHEEKDGCELREAHAQTLARHASLRTRSAGRQRSTVDKGRIKGR